MERVKGCESPNFQEFDREFGVREFESSRVRYFETLIARKFETDREREFEISTIRERVRQFRREFIG